jgi:uncharacterized protein (DUF1800 family)
MSSIRQLRPLATFSWRTAFAAVLGAAIAAALSGCGGEADRPPSATAAAPEIAPDAHASRGQVTPASTQRVSFYAASRFAEQASFGPTPALVAELQAKGFERWIDEQFALPIVPVDMRAAEAIYAYPFNVSPPDSLFNYLDGEFAGRAVAGADQLRLRVTWSLSQFVVAAATKGEVPGWVEWHNLLYRNAFGRYYTLLRQASVDSHMGHYLDNDQNRPKSAECPHCAPNENYARELMQLFTIGVYKLNPDGTPQRDNRGRFIETYTQRDVEELSRVLTGWTRDFSGPQRPQRNWGNWGQPMIPSTWPPDRDSGTKTVLGRVFPAAQGAQRDLDDAIDLLMAHPNIAPFVALRLIQHLVKSDPTPAYVGRVAAKFSNNGSGVRGDMRAVVKAVLLDAEARTGDNPAAARRDDGKFREPFLYSSALWRGLGCTTMPKQNWSDVRPAISGQQEPFRQSSVFSFYAPTDRAPGSNLLAPEQRLITTEELRGRVNQALWPVKYDNGRMDSTRLRDAGCKTDEFTAAFTRSSSAYADLLAQRFFRGAMPPTLRSNMVEIMSMQWPPYNKNEPLEGAMRMLNFATLTPYYGVIK